MPTHPPPSSFSLWLEEALTGWILPVAGLLLAGGAWGLYLLDHLPEGPTAAVLAVLVALVGTLAGAAATLLARLGPWGLKEAAAPAASQARAKGRSRRA